MTITYRPIPGFDSETYRATSEGFIEKYSPMTKLWRQMKGFSQLDNNGSGLYPRYRVVIKKKGYLVATLIAAAFHGVKPSHLVVCHNNSVCSDNRPENLRYDTQKNNIIDAVKMNNGPQQKITVEQATEIRNLYKTGQFTQAELGDLYTVSQACISYCVSGKTFVFLPL